MARRFNGSALKPTEALYQIEQALALAVLWIVAIAIGIGILENVVPTEYSLSDVIFEVASALGAAGLSTGITQPSLHWVGKYLLILLMWMGRLEIIPVLLLLKLLTQSLLLPMRKK